METPHDRVTKHDQQRPNRFSDNYAESLADQFVNIEGDLEDDLNFDQDSPPIYPHMASSVMTVAFDQMHNPSLQPYDSSTQSSRSGSPYRRTESLDSIVSAASISSINIEETKTDTGVTIDEIQTFITGPDADAKWTCIYESCGKKFGRKENIKSHVQTHLNDRQYQCPSCKKCFVRKSDLKRHAKIHTGIKPYLCECGTPFLRHHALTRHRKRGMCIGTFDGVVRKVVKRGRPTKHRPDMEDRFVKSDMTRRKAKATENASRHGSTHSSASCQSGYSDSSAGNFPYNDFDGVLDDVGFPDMDMIDVNNMPDSTSSLFDSARLSLSSRAPSIATTFEDATTNHTYTTVSPEAPFPAISNYSYTYTLPTHAQNPSPAPNSPAKSPTSHNYTHHACSSVHSPPEVEFSTSSSLPASSSATVPQSQPPRFFELTDDSEFDPNQSTMSDHSIGLGTTVAGQQATVSRSRGDLSGLGMDDMLLPFRNGEEMMMEGGNYFEKKKFCDSCGKEK